MSNLLVFKTISNFVLELGSLYSMKYKPLACYKHLIEHTKIIHEEPIQKHISAFRQFCQENRNAIMEMNENELTSQITYSKKVYIDLKAILKDCNSDTKKTIWTHVLSISALVDPLSTAKQVLASRNEKQDGNEETFISEIMEKVEGSIGKEALGNPMTALSSLMSSGLITELATNMQSKMNDGSLDINKLIGTVQGMVAGANIDVSGILDQKQIKQIE